MRNNLLLDKLMNNNRIRDIGLKKETISEILESYYDIILNHLLENGYIELDEGLNIEIIQLTDRVHVLRGTPYKNSRKYKLKMTMTDDVYKKIEYYYDKLKEEIL